MYYLKYRPRTVAQLDNTSARSALSNILNSAALPHAYLFSGQKGTGKTSTARIFAKSINCLENKFAGKGSSTEPCITCPNCVSIENSSSADVTEMDAASNRGIDEIRSLIRESSFSPMTGKYRVFIIDEAHMITTDAFNALLKTLEEPPSSVIFILATTNEEKIPKTIQSRCMKVSFGKAHRTQVRNMLERIAQAEKLKVPEELLDLVAHRSDESFRDGAKLLEELVIQNKLTLEDASEYLNVRSHTGLFELLDKKNPKEVFAWIDGYAELGGNFSYLLEALLEHLRERLLSLYGVGDETGKAGKLTKKEITKLLKLLSDANGMMRATPIPSLPLEIAFAEFYNDHITKGGGNV